MSDKKELIPEGLKKPAQSPKIPIERLRDDCMKLFGITVSTFNGATYGLTGDFTVKEMGDRIEKWKNGRAFPATKKEGN